MYLCMPHIGKMDFLVVSDGSIAPVGRALRICKRKERRVGKASERAVSALVVVGPGLDGFEHGGFRTGTGAPPRSG